MKFKNKTVLITGAASGLGRELAINIPCKTLILIDTNQEELRKTISKTNKQCYEYIMDCSIEQNWKNLHEYLKSINVIPDVVINNAGRNMSFKSVEDIYTEDFFQIFNNNFYSALFGSREFITDMKQKNTECLITNVSSSFGLFVSKNFSAYCSSKFAISGFTQCLRQELKNTNITVSIVYPGSMPTNIVDNGLLAYGENITPDLLSVSDSFKKYAITPTSHAAKKIIKNLEQHKERILIGFDTKFMDCIIKFCPVLYDFIMIHFADKFYRH